MSYNNVNVNVSGPVQPTSTYKTNVLKGNHSFASQVTEPNTKYVIKHDFDLGGESVTIPEGCLLEFDGGSLKNGILNGELHTTKGYIDFREIGGIYEDNTKGVHNRNCLTVLSGITNKVSLMFSKDVYLSGTTNTALFQSLELFGNKTKVYCNSFNRFFVSKDLTIHDLHFVSTDGCTLFQLDNSKNASRIHIYNNVFEGDARIFNCFKDLSHTKDSYESKEDSFNYCIESLVIEDNIFDNVFNKDGSRMLFRLMDSYVNYTRFSNNQVHNFYASILYYGVDNDGVDNYGNTYSSLIADNYLVKGRKIIISNNIIHNDLLWKPWLIDTDLGFYYCIALCESGDLIFENNSVKNIISFTAKPVYDVYQATNTVVYRNNIIKNVASLNTESEYNSIIKAKTGGTYKHYTGNSFIFDDLQTIFELNYPIITKLFDNEGGALNNLVISNNVFDIHNLIFNANSPTRAINLIFKNNKLHVANALPVGNRSLIDSGVEGVTEVAYNTITVDNIEADAGNKYVPFVCDYANNQVICHDNNLTNVGLTAPESNSISGEYAIFKDNDLNYTINLNNYGSLFIERLFKCTVNNNKIKISGTQTGNIKFINLLSNNINYNVNIKTENIGGNNIVLPIIDVPNIDYSYINGIIEGIIHIKNINTSVEKLYNFILFIKASTKYIKYYNLNGVLTVTNLINGGSEYVYLKNLKDSGESTVRYNHSDHKLELLIGNNSNYDINVSLKETDAFEYLTYYPKKGLFANIPTSISLDNIGTKYIATNLNKELTFLYPNRNVNPEWTDSSIAVGSDVFTNNPATESNKYLCFYVKYHTNLSIYYSKVSSNPTDEDLIRITKTASNFSYTSSYSPDPSIYPYIYIHNGNSSINEVKIYKTGIPWFEEDGVEAGISRSGTTRPVGSKIYVGFQFFDTSVGINKPIYASAINGDTVTWVDATGATV